MADVDSQGTVSDCVFSDAEALGLCRVRGDITYSPILLIN